MDIDDMCIIITHVDTRLQSPNERMFCRSVHDLAPPPEESPILRSGGRQRPQDLRILIHHGDMSRHPVTACRLAPFLLHRGICLSILK